MIIEAEHKFMQLAKTHLFFQFWWLCSLLFMISACGSRPRPYPDLSVSKYTYIIDHEIDYKELISTSESYASWIIVDGGAIVCPDGECQIKKRLRIETLAQVFYGEGHFVFMRNTLDEINPRYWGAKGDDKTDNYIPIQRAIDAAIQSVEVSRVKFDGGVFRISKSLIAGRIKNAAFTFFGLTLEGAGPVYDINTSLADVTVIKTGFTNGFALGLQACRGVEIRNLSIVGNNRRELTLNEVYELDESQWNAHGIRDDRYSPYSGIVIDPFHEIVPPGNGYPGLSQFYIMSPGSSAVKIEGCKISGFAAGICISPNGSSTQGDNISISNCFIDYAKAGIAICQSQSRSIVVNNLTVHTLRVVFDAETYGAKQGQLPEVNAVLATQVQWLFKCSSGVAYGHFKNVYAEEIFGLGYSMNPFGILPINFEQCVFEFRLPVPFKGKRTRSNPTLLQCNMASFNGCFLGYSADIDKYAPLNFDVANLSFINSTLDLPAINSNLDYFQKLHNVHYDNVLFKCLQSNASVRSGGTIYNIAPEKISAYVVAPGQTITDTRNTKYINLTNGYDYYMIDTRATLRVDTAAIEAILTTSNSGLYQSGDQILIDIPGTRTGIGNHARTCIGIVKERRGNDIILGSISYGLTDGTYTTYCARLPYIKYRSTGDIVQNSTIIRNVFSDIPLQQIWKLGDKINAQGIVKGTWVVKVEENVIEMSHPAIESVIATSLEDANLRKVLFSSSSPESGSWKAGDIIYNTYLQSKVPYLWQCTTSGTFGISAKPSFINIPNNR